MENNIKKLIIEEYLSGKGSTSIEKKYKISKSKILKILNDEKLIRKKDRCSNLNIHEKKSFFIIERNCPVCNKLLETKSKHKTIACRNHFNKIKKKSLCKDCYKKNYSGSNNSFYGKKHSEESKNKISKKRKGILTGDKNPMKNDLYKERARINLKKRWESGDLEVNRKRMSDIMKKTIKSGRLKSFNVSKKEKEIKEKIELLGFDTINSFRVETKICDIYVPSLNLIIEYFGDYWHCNPEKYDKDYFNVKKNKYAWEIWKYDQNKLETIRNSGYNLEIIWEKNYSNNNKIINSIIEKYDKKRTTTPERSGQD